MSESLRLFRYIAPPGSRIGLARDGRLVDLTSVSGFESLSAWLSLPDPVGACRQAAESQPEMSITLPELEGSGRLLPPIDRQEVWAAGVTYLRSKVARIEGANPLYLPQAKVYWESCALGPVIVIEEEPREHREFSMRMRITRAGESVFMGETSTARMKRRFAELIEYLMRDNLFPDGAFLLTGTGIIPPDDFTLEPGDQIDIGS